MSAVRPVVAAIPHYNMAETLRPLLEQTVEQGYDAIYVLDDNSTTGDVEDVVAPFRSDVTLIRGQENRGAGGNRNRILEADPKRLGGAIVQFIDADCEIVSERVPERARDAMADSSIGALGGLVLNADGVMDMYNFNPRISWKWLPAVETQKHVANLARRHPAWAGQLRDKLGGFLAGFPDTLEEPTAQDAFCVLEANMLVPYDAFAAVKGFDDRLRYHETQDLSYKFGELGLRERFDPSIAVRHLDRGENGAGRFMENLRGIYTVARTHGMPLK